MTAPALVRATSLSAATVNKTLALLEGMGLVAELTGGRRGRVFAYRAYVELINAGLDEAMRHQSTGPSSSPPSASPP